MAVKLTIRLSDEAARWIRQKAAVENISVSRFVSAILERRMRQTEEYWQAYERWKKLIPEHGVPGVDASLRWTREEIYGNRR